MIDTDSNRRLRAYPGESKMNVPAFTLTWTDGGETATVRLSRSAIDDFRTRWPASGLPSKALKLVLCSDRRDIVSAPAWFTGEAAGALLSDIRQAIIAISGKVI